MSGELILGDGPRRRRNSPVATAPARAKRRNSSASTRRSRGRAIAPHGPHVLLALSLLAASTCLVPSAAAAAAAAAASAPALPSVPNLMARSGAAVRSASSGMMTRGGGAAARSVSRRIGGLRLPLSDGTSSARLVTRKKRRANNTGFYYGIREDVFFPPSAAEEEEEGGGGRDGGGATAGPKTAAAGPGGSGSESRGQRLLASSSPPRQDSAATSRAALSDVMGETLLELREMREEISALRDEMRVMKRRMRSAVDYEDGGGDESGGGGGEGRSGEIPGSDRRRLLAQGEEADEPAAQHRDQQEHGMRALMAKRRKAREFDRIGQAVEQWAEKMLFEEGGEEDGWKEVACNKMVRNKFNKEGTTTCFIKWMKDSRSGDPDVTGVARGGGSGDGNGGRAEEDDKEYPCIKVYSTIDAPLESVCAYLADEARMEEYNDLIISHRELEEITPHSKITWGQCPQILFIKPRDFVTFCHHRWKKDGTQVIVNQAVEHADAPGHHSESDGKDGDGRVCRAQALRGANFIGRDPDDPSKTRFALLAQADPGGGIPQWATRTAMNALAPIEPFKLFHNIERGIHAALDAGTIHPTRNRAEMAAAKIPGRSSKPGGLSQMGYACFWPDGGGLKEGFLHQEQHHPHDDDMYPHEPVQGQQQHIGGGGGGGGQSPGESRDFYEPL